MSQAILWIRHGATDWNLDGRYLGGTDLPLNDVGRAEVKRLLTAYRQATVRTLFTSPLQRARESAELLRRAWRCDLVVDERLKELHFGTWEGLTTEAIRRKYPELWKRWLQCTVTGPFPGGGENFTVFHRRVGAFVKEHCTRVKTPCAVVAHGGVLRTVMLHLLQLPPAYYWSFHFGRASVSCTRHDGTHVSVEYLNRCFSDEAKIGVDEHA